MKTTILSILFSLVLLSCAAQNSRLKTKDNWRNAPAAANKLPVANAGADRAITLPVSNLVLTGTATDADGTIAARLWTQVSGPSTAVLTNPTTNALTASSLVAGVYVFNFHVTDNKAATDSDNVTVTVNKALNIPPVASAGADIVLTLPVSSTTLSGSATDADGTVVAYAWEQVSGPTTATMATPNLASTTISALIQGTYIFKITATDNSGGTGTDQVTVTVKAAPANIPPVPNAGIDQVITLPVATVTVQATATDADGTVTGYVWEQVSGPSTASIQAPTSATTAIFDLVAGTYQFKVTATDNSGGTGTDIILVTVNAAANILPTVDAGTTLTITNPLDSVTIAAVATDEDGQIVTWLWTKLSGPSGGTIADADTAITQINGLQVGTYRFQITVTDDLGGTATDYMEIVVQSAPPVNIPPVGDAGINQILTLPVNSTTVSGTGTDADGTVEEYSWQQFAGPSYATIQSPGLQTTLISNLIAGTYIFRLTVTDNEGATGASDIQITVNPAINIPPVANAGVNKVITLPTSFTTLNGSGTDMDGTITNYLWRKISGPTGGTIASPITPTTSITGLSTAGTYIYQLRVTDNNGDTAIDQVQILVNPAVPANIPPVVNAGANVSITLPANSATLSGSATDADGTITGYVWTKISGPSGGTIGSPTSATTLISSMVQGFYVFRLTATDNSSATGFAEVSINVSGAANVPPTVNAGTDQTITLPANSVTVTATATDTDGTIVSYAWARSSGPANFTITSPATAGTTITGLEAGTYVFQITVRDNSGLVATDAITITVLPPVGAVNNGNATFTLAVAGRVSASVSTYTDSTIIKHLFSDSMMSAGSHTINWNNTDDFGNLIQFPASKYIIKVTSNNIVAEWQGTIGNSSLADTGSTKHRGYYRHMSDLVFGPNFGYYVTGYSEGTPSIAKFAIDNPNVKIALYGHINTGDLNYLAIDTGNYYIAGFDPNVAINSFVFAKRISNDAEVQFPLGTRFESKYGRDYPYAVSITARTGSVPTGLAVQRTGQYLFVARGGIDSLYVVNKVTGAPVRQIFMDSIRQIAISPTNNNSFWGMTGSGTVAKYTINGDGSLSAPLLTLSGLVNPVSVEVSTDGLSVKISDGGTSQQVKTFNEGTGALTGTQGTAGGYYTSASVTNNKFFFTSVDGLRTGEKRMYPFIAFQPDGSFWVNDAGNFRSQHYTAANSFLERIQFLGSTYTSCIDVNRTNRLFVGLLEFNVNPVAKTWELVKNWGARMSIYTYDFFKYDVKFVTLSNGRTYGLIRNGNSAEILELSNTGDTCRPTGILRTGYSLGPDGKLYQFLRGNIGGTSTMRSYASTGFSGINPTWSATPVTVFTTPTLTFQDPNAGPRTANTIITSRNKAIMFEAGAGAVNDGRRIITPKDGWHLEGIALGTNKVLFKNQLGTHLNYQGVYPDGGGFDVGNIVSDFAGGGMSVLGRIILTSYHGEFWKNGQTNYFTLYLDNGSSLYTFGVDRTYHTQTQSAPWGMAGNVLTPQLVLDTLTGNFYLYHGDESDHSGIGYWKISGMNTIVEQDIVINGVTAPITRPTTIMTGLPWDVVLPMTAARWTRTHGEDTTDQYTQLYNVQTSILNYKKLETPDIYVKFLDKRAITKTVSGNLGTNNVTTGWKLTGLLAYPNNMPNGLSMNQYLDVLDATGKILIRFYPFINRSVNPFQAGIIGNGQSLLAGSETVIRRAMNRQLPFEFKIVGGVVTITYGTYTKTATIFDATANWHTPTTIRIMNVATATTAGVYGEVVDVSHITYSSLDP